MIWNPFKKKEQTQEGEETQKSSIADKLEKELDALPSVFKAKLQDPVVKERFMNIARRMEADGVNFKSIRQMKKWMKDHEAELRAEMTPVRAAAARNTKNAAALVNRPLLKDTLKTNSSEGIFLLQYT